MQQVLLIFSDNYSFIEYNGRIQWRNLKLYLKNREITDEIISDFTLGWASNKYDSLYKELHKEFNDDAIREVLKVFKSLINLKGTRLNIQQKGTKYKIKGTRRKCE